MVNKYTTKIDLNKRKTNLKNHSRFTKKNSRNYQSGRLVKNPFKKMSTERKKKLKRVFAVMFAIFFVITLAVFLRFMWYLQEITKDLPSPDEPFGIRNESSIIYSDPDEEGDPDELYKLFGEENLDFVSIDEIPEHVKWAVLAAEDIDFYEHPGFDVGGLIRATMFELFGVGSQSGGSTVTQQLIKNTAIGDERTVERKIKEIILSLQVERLYSKDQILEMYLNVNNYGSNIYGIKTASKFYFDKENLNDLTLAEAAVLARIPQTPLYNSPTLAPDPEDGKRRAKLGQEYVLDQMSANLNKINDHIESDDNIILQEEIEAAKEQEMVYEKPRIDITAPHFVFYVREILTTGNYNNGEPFDLSQLETGGYKIYTTLNTTLQQIAEEEVAAGVEKYAKPYGGNNGAAIITEPATGDILAMVGSKDYFAESEGTVFDGKVNVTDTFQSMGSTMKPSTYTLAFEKGISSPGSYLPDIPIEINGYKPKNWNGSFKGPEKGATARLQLRESRNIPAVILSDAVGLSVYEDYLIKWGYETIANGKGNYGPSLTLGGGDVTMIEHAQGYGVLANGGQLVKLDPIRKITKIDPETGEEVDVYNKEIVKEPVADQRAVYMTNNILNYKTGGPGVNIDGRDYAGKTGTTELSKDTLYAGYTPDFVLLTWNGNNDNSSMSSRAYGENVSKPWAASLSERIAPFFPEKSSFPRPGGIISGNSCSNTTNSDSDENIECADSGGDLLIEGKIPPSYIYKQTFRVCSDQDTKLAREIDERLGFVTDKEVKLYKMPSPSLQKFLDAAMKSSELIPTEECDVSRSPNGQNPWASFQNPKNNATVSGSMDVSVIGYSVQGAPTKIELYLGNPANGLKVGEVSGAKLDVTVDLTPYDTAKLTLVARVYDSLGLVGDTSVNIVINGATNDNLTKVSPSDTVVAGDTASIEYAYTGTYTFSSMQAVVKNIDTGASTTITVPVGGAASWAPEAGNYTIQFVGTTSQGFKVYSSTFTVKAE